MVDVADELDRRIGAFEAAWSSGTPRLAAFLPSPDDLIYGQCLSELIRVDLEFRRKRGQAATLDDYRTVFPELFKDKSILREIAYEEYRLRIASGESPHPREYESYYGIDTSQWPIPSHPAAAGDSVARSFPKAGEIIDDFELIEELGRGSFAKVYLSRQRGLAGRSVALKISTKFGEAEPETLARLQHTHIVPIYSSHRSGPFQLIVMPYLGATTLADLIANLRTRQTRPVSGQELTETIALHRGKSVPASHSATDFDLAISSGRQNVAGVVWRSLSRFSFADAVLWIGARLAEGLAHAHERGILHRDVKPGNVLLTDDGQPMLLDFNLAADTMQVDPTIGGTPAYMSPEQLKQLQGEPTTIDARADIYSLGLVLFEALTAQQPYDVSSHPLPKSSVADLIHRRLKPPVDPRSLNRNISPSAAAIVLKCLEPDPNHRYPTAKALAEDLDRQLNNLPLIHTREHSWPERFRKWRRRHPRLTSSGSVAAIALFVVVALGSALYARHERIRTLEFEQAQVRAREAATEKFRGFRTESRIAVPLLTVHNRDPEKFREGEQRALDLLGRYSVIERPDWMDDDSVRYLSDADRLTLRTQVAEILTTVARVRADRAMVLPLGAHRESELSSALGLIDRAQSAYPPDMLPRSVSADRAQVLARLGRKAPAIEPPSDLSQAARDLYLAGTAAMARGRYHEAIPPLEEATNREPQQFWAWFNLGVAYMGAGRDASAEGCFNAAIALEPDHPMAHFNRGLTRLNRGLNVAAEIDFSSALRLKVDFKDAYSNRAMALTGLSRFSEAEADLTKNIELDPTETRLFFLRADVRERQGNTAAARTDHEEGMNRRPADERSWITRGLARASKDPQGALADFDEALKLNPHSLPALQNKASVLAEQPGQTANAIAVLDKALEFAPDSLLTLAGRAVMLARSGDRTTAHRDADRCISLGPGPEVIYQLAGVYALTSKTHPEDARTAYRLLADALRLGYGFQHIDTDPDLFPVRETEEFKKIVSSARESRSK
ncbi:MAG: protein kinase domain-containing protein [Gemmataceae bacterium]